MAGLMGGSSSKTLRVQEFRASGTFTVPTGVKTIELFLVGAGGGGGATQGGGPGQVLRTKYDVNGKNSCVVVIGAGGAADAANGGDSTFDGVVVAVGGIAQAGFANSGAPVVSVSGNDGFGGIGSGSANVGIVGNGARMLKDGAANSGAGGAFSKAGGSGYARVEWYE